MPMLTLSIILSIYPSFSPLSSSLSSFSTVDGAHLGDLEGHEDAVQSVLFDPNGKFLVSASSDQTFRIWS
jgi:WD40 repeat protein